MRLAHFVIFHRVERSAALDPRIDRIGRDDVEFLFGGADEMPAIIEDYFGPWIMHDTVVLFLEHRGHKFRDQWLDVANDDAFDVGVYHKRASGHARSASYHRNGF